MKRPWLLTPNGQRTSMHLANLVSLALFVGFVLNFSLVELPRQEVRQLDSNNVSYCALDECAEIQGLVLTSPNSISLESTEFGEMLSLDFTNTDMLTGKRELWLKVETSDGRILEMASTEIKLDPKNRTIAKFLLVSEKELILGSKLSLGY